jgi:hypothetical protein
MMTLFDGDDFYTTGYSELEHSISHARIGLCESALRLKESDSTAVR